MKLTETLETKTFFSKDYNYVFQKKSGLFLRWGKNKADDPQYSPFGPEIIDIEIAVDGCPTTKNADGTQTLCRFCYKGNTAGTPRYMNLETFQRLLSKFPKYDNHHFACSIAFGITSVTANPDLFQIMNHCLDEGIVPNLTISGRDVLSEQHIFNLSTLAGAIAVSVYQDAKDNAYNLIQELIKRDVQTNIHLMVSEETKEYALEVAKDVQNDPRLKGLNALVFLGLKPKGRGVTYRPMSFAGYQSLINYCLASEISFGFDSCSCHKFQEVIKGSDMDKNKKNMLTTLSEPCESGLFSSYVNVDGKYWHCSFTEDIEPVGGLDVLNCQNFMTDVWDSPKMIEWRNKLFTLSRQCPVYKEIHV